MRKQSLPLVFLCLATVLALLCASARSGRTKLTVVQYTLSSEKITQPLRLVQLVDLHGHEFGENNALLIQQVHQQEPDLILMTGDMLDKSDETAEVPLALVRELTEIAPVYWGHGNHETYWMGTRSIDLNDALAEAGAVVLDVGYTDVRIGEQPLRIGGFSGYYGYPGMLRTTEEAHVMQNAFFADFEDTRDFKLLLCHIPTSWLDWRDIDRKPVDLVLSGHYHGGQINIPFLGGLIAPYVGWFPEYTEGLYKGEQATCILSTGLSSSPGVPRINNLPQIVVVDLVPQKIP